DSRLRQQCNSKTNSFPQVDASSGKNCLKQSIHFLTEYHKTLNTPKKKDDYSQLQRTFFSCSSRVKINSTIADYGSKYGLDSSKVNVLKRHLSVQTLFLLLSQNKIDKDILSKQIIQDSVDNQTIDSLLDDVNEFRQTRNSILNEQKEASDKILTSGWETMKEIAKKSDFFRNLQRLALNPAHLSTAKERPNFKFSEDEKRTRTMAATNLVKILEESLDITVTKKTKELESNFKNRKVKLLLNALFEDGQSPSKKAPNKDKKAAQELLTNFLTNTNQSKYFITDIPVEDILLEVFIAKFSKEEPIPILKPEESEKIYSIMEKQSSAFSELEKNRKEVTLKASSYDRAFNFVSSLLTKRNPLLSEMSDQLKIAKQAYSRFKKELLKITSSTQRNKSTNHFNLLRTTLRLGALACVAGVGSAAPLSRRSDAPLSRRSDGDQPNSLWDICPIERNAEGNLPALSAINPTELRLWETISGPNYQPYSMLSQSSSDYFEQPGFSDNLIDYINTCAASVGTCPNRTILSMGGVVGNSEFTDLNGDPYSKLGDDALSYMLADTRFSSDPFDSLVLNIARYHGEPVLGIVGIDQSTPVGNYLARFIKINNAVNFTESFSVVESGTHDITVQIASSDTCNFADLAFRNHLTAVFKKQDGSIDREQPFSGLSVGQTFQLTYSPAYTLEIKDNAGNIYLTSSLDIPARTNYTDSAPVISVANTDCREAEPCNIQVTATGYDGDGARFSLIGESSGLSIDSATGLISGSITDQSIPTGPLPITVRYTYPNPNEEIGGDLFVDREIEIDYRATDEGPVLQDPETPFTLTEGGVFNPTIIASDPDTPVLVFSLKTGTFPSGMTISPDGLVSWNGPGEFVPSGDIHFTVEVTDGTSTVEKIYTIAYTATNDAPVLHDPESPFTLTEDGRFNQTIVATDADHASEHLTFS
ncbi:hypothetical protein DID78_07240, partial [Candidatus Marinamargulisbacteria bacterium SCGC AG-343-D04]